MRPALLFFASLIATSIHSFAQQQTISRYEVGIQTNYLRTEQVYSRLNDNPNQWGVGPAFTVNLTENFAVDSSFNAFFGQRYMPTLVAGGRLIEGVAGIKATIRGKHFGLFVKGRPGFVSWSKGISAIQGSSVTTRRRTYFAADIGGGIELYPTRHLVLRSELGDTYIRFTPPVSHFGEFRYNLQASTTVAYRVGRESETEVPGGTRGEHAFFDRANVALMSASLLAQTADAITTQRFLADCRRLRFPNCSYHEPNPLARPLVRNGWSGQIGYLVISNTVQTMIQYAVHRMGHHRIERFVPIPSTIASGILAYKNLQE